MTRIHPSRIRRLNNIEASEGKVVYWMSRDQRVQDNWALLYAQEEALKKKSGLCVFFGLSPHFLDATIRQYDFMLKGLEEIEQALRKLGIEFVLATGNPVDSILKYASTNSVSLIVTDFSPLRISREWRAEAASKLKVPLFEVDTHNIVPCWHASPKLEFAAYTFRPKVNKLLDEFLTPVPEIKKHPYPNSNVSTINWENFRQSLRVNHDVSPVTWIQPGEKAAARTLNEFLAHKLRNYDEQRNNPSLDAQSHLSPYLHFGHISAQRIAFEASRLPPSQSTQSFLEELIVRRELSDNFCYYQVKYDTPDAFPNWAKTSLQQHLKDPREYLYSREVFERGETHDPLWNAAQTEMVTTGKMHGYMRMYWAKKILEWTDSPSTALAIAIYLNDKYELDGRDPNGYAGIAWSIGGVHDRAWFERPIFGKVRYMSYNGCKSKFDIKAYIQKSKNAHLQLQLA